jgi:hypothetical protein
MPTYLVEVLLENLPPIEAYELNNAITAASLPHTEESERRSVLKRLEHLANQLDAKVIASDPELEPAPMAHDPEKALEYFRQMGVKLATTA